MDQRRGSGRAWLWFTLVRIAIFAVVLTVLLLVMPVEPWISAIIAAVIALCLSFIFLAGPRARLAEQLHEQRAGRTRDRDGEDEDAALDSPDLSG